MSEARVEAVDALGIPTQVVQLLRTRIPSLTRRITARVQAEIPAYAGPESGRRRKLIAMAVSESAGLFLRRLDGNNISTTAVDDLFRRMGYGEGREGNTLDALEAALRLAGRDAWHRLQEAVVTAGLSARTLGRLGDELTGFLDHLAEEARAGHAMALRALERDVAVNRGELFEALVRGAASTTVGRLAELAGWPVPSELVAVAAEVADTDPPTPVAWPDTDTLEGRALVRCDERRAAYLVQNEDLADLIAQLRRLGSGVVIAQVWPVAAAEVSHAYRWAVHTLELAAIGAIPRQPLIDCSRYRTQLWLHSEPALRRQLAQELLRPLFAETPNSREILSATLLVWLETRESAPAIAAILGVHPQTVRYRWRRINELFGEALHDSEFIVQLTMVLKATVPLWVAGDQTDFEHYWTNEAAR